MLTPGGPVCKVRNEFYKNTHGALLVYDVTNRSSFESLGDWLTEIRSHLHDPGELESIVFVVCANKVRTAHTMIRIPAEVDYLMFVREKSIIIIGKYTYYNL